MDTLEHDIEAKLRRMIERRGGLCLKWVCPGWAGVPDRILLLPGGRILFAETKRPKGGRTAALQIWWQDRLHALGFQALRICNAADIQALEAELGEVSP